MIDNDINSLISMAERQSDQRLAQELNPQTETGLLGPTFISASELAYRKKVREEAQAQPNQSPPIVQQLAQQATMSPVQPMPTAPMQQPMPMPQQPMAPQGFAMGGLIKMANGGQPGNPYLRMANTGQPTDVMGNYPFTFDGSGNVVQDSFELDPIFNQPINDLPVDLQDTSSFMPQSMPDSNIMIDESLARLEREQKRQPVFLQNVGQSIADFSNRIQTRIDARKEAEAERKRKESIVVDQDKLLQGLNPRQANNIPIPDLQIRDASIAGPPTASNINSAAQTHSGSAGVLTSATGTTPISTTATGTPITPAQQNALIAKAKASSSPLIPPSTTSTGTINSLPTSGVSNAAKQDAAYAASSDYETLIQQSIDKMTDDKGKMQNKWLRIAAGAFNAAQKGSPTLLGGLADLGSGVTEQLLALDKDEQKQAQELFALYSAREKIRYDRYTTKRDYDKDRQTRLSDSIKNYNADLARYLNTDITKDMTKREAEAITAITYADQGVKPAQGNYGRFVKEIQGIVNDINTSDPDLTDAEFQQILDERIKSDKALAIIYDNYTDRGTQGVEDWLDVQLTI